MALSPGMVFVENIEPTHENADAMVHLTLEDLIRGGFKNPLSLADPSNPAHVELQLQRLRNHPERYCGYMLDGKLVAYMKHNHWRLADERPFALGLQALALLVFRLLRIDPYEGRWWGVFGLVVSNDIATVDRDKMLLSLLHYSMKDPRTRELRTVNIVTNYNDPVYPLLLPNGFISWGKTAEAAGAPGLKQRRYRRSRGYKSNQRV